ncbi:hypothetical protein CBR_g42126 [Chara braunii]|uniref:DUF4283 domain-containing protein n=1 Tax=Chara braunii TaxID=69332 RepID=A0A388LX62_CHABU|nr:hypothetical protein CBR_g42126 [Chara braunii]|eukprot:GBG86843.1 hypothetical protein CBR_g42126 [Chara braunii]
MVGAEGTATPGPQAGGEEETDKQNRSPPPSQTNYWIEEERVRDMLSRCFDAGMLPSGWDIGEMKEEGQNAHFTLNPSLDEIKVKWLKERTVTVIFQEGSKNLPKKIKEDVIRAFENIWIGEGRFDSTITRGRVCIESSNVLSYVAKDWKVVEWMLEEQEARVSLRGRWHSIIFKPWMTKVEIQEAKNEADRNYFWIRILDVPLDAFCYLESSVEQAIGTVQKVYPSEKDARTPQLINVRMDIDVDFLPRVKELISFTTYQGQLIELKVANALTPWCSTCRRYFHRAEDCIRTRRRRGSSPHRQQSPTPSSSSSASSSVPPSEGSGRRNSPSSPRSSQGRDRQPSASRSGGRSVRSHKSSSRGKSPVELVERRSKQPTYKGKLAPGSVGGGGTPDQPQGVSMRENPMFSPGMGNMDALLHAARRSQRVDSVAARGRKDAGNIPSSQGGGPEKSQGSKQESGNPRLTPTKLRRRLSEDMSELRIQELEDQHSPHRESSIQQGQWDSTTGKRSRQPTNAKALDREWANGVDSGVGFLRRAESSILGSTVQLA